MITASEMTIAARMNGMDYGRFEFLLGCGRVTMPPMSEIRAQLVTKKRRGGDSAGNPHAVVPVICYDYDGNFIKSYPSIAVAAELLGKHRNMISSACRGVAKSAYGFQWRYEGDEPPGKYVKGQQTIKIATKRAPVDKTCEVCGKPFKGVGRAKFCSDACSLVRKREHGRKAAAKRRAAKKKEAKAA